ncbi:glucans biosynthesis glucosyltransferase MdoH [Variovorax robiniae]|uniref:Glucans biosynthesis glucosyltransferase H n=1 Tax=Variovorax robiniae TaxID=1836199 RepID=A0ABU8X158_9BURK
MRRDRDRADDPGAPGGRRASHLHPTRRAVAPHAVKAAEAVNAGLRWRRAGFALAVAATVVALVWLMAATLFVERVDAIGLGMLLAFAVTLPWTVVGFWNAAIGLALMSASRDPAGLVAPHLHAADPRQRIEASTALLACIRNEDTGRLSRNLAWMLDGLVNSGQAAAFQLYVLSDSDDPGIVAAEAGMVAQLEARFGSAVALHYRRREQHHGFKAGNIRGFCERWGSLHDYAIVLDADSLMTPQAMLRLVRIMQARPGIGILQTLVTGLPSASAFTRMFQFGMRLGMRSYTLGAASWQGDCGPYWGHNAILRLPPFIEHCKLPELPGPPPLGGPVLSHDQLEAVLMRRAGYEVRVLPDEQGSWEENPPNILEFIRRDLRWCQGNMQYLQLLGLPGLRPVSRCQLLLAIAMYLGAPAWLAFMMLGMWREQPFRADFGLVLFIAVMGMNLAPKLATIVDVLLRAPLRRAYGGAPRIVCGALLEFGFWVLTGPVVAVAVTLFLLGLPFGRRVGWAAQQRDVQRIDWRVALRGLWPQTALGLVLAGLVWWRTPGAIWLWSPVLAGLIGSIPFACWSAHHAVGRWLVRWGMCRIPEEAPVATGLAPHGLPVHAPGATVPAAE